jgi:hypothetical protein
MIHLLNSLLVCRAGGAGAANSGNRQFHPTVA